MNAERWHRAAEVFEGALDRPEPEKGDSIRQACDGDPIFSARSKRCSRTYVETGFPHGRSQFISTAVTA